MQMQTARRDRTAVGAVHAGLVGPRHNLLNTGNRSLSALQSTSYGISMASSLCSRYVKSDKLAMSLSSSGLHGLPVSFRTTVSPGKSQLFACHNQQRAPLSPALGCTISTGAGKLSRTPSSDTSSEASLYTLTLATRGPAPRRSLLAVPISRVWGNLAQPSIFTPGTERVAAAGTEHVAAADSGIEPGGATRASTAKSAARASPGSSLSRNSTVPARASTLRPRASR